MLLIFTIREIYDIVKFKIIKKLGVNKLIGVIWIICGIIIMISAVLTKKDPAKVLASQKRKQKANLSDEEYVARVYKTSIILGIVMIALGVLWVVMY